MDFPSNSVSPLCLSPPTYVPSTGLTWRRHIVRVCVIGYDGTSWEPRWLVSWFLIRRLNMGNVAVDGVLVATCAIESWPIERLAWRLDVLARVCSPADRCNQAAGEISPES